MVAYECDAQQHAVGNQHWLRYRNNGVGFERQPTLWTLLGLRQHSATEAHFCVNGDLTSTLAMAANGSPDLVVTGVYDDIGGPVHTTRCLQSPGRCMP